VNERIGRLGNDDRRIYPTTRRQPVGAEDHAAVVPAARRKTIGSAMIKTLTIVLLLLIILPVHGIECAEGNSDSLPKGGGEPGKAFMAFLEAAHKKDFAKIRGMYPAEVSKKITDKDLEASLGMFILFDASTLSITGGSIKGDSATLNTLSHGTITMQRMNGKWLMKQWSAHAETTTEMSINAEATFNGGAIKSSNTEAPLTTESPDVENSLEPAVSLEQKEIPNAITFTFDPQTLQVAPEDEKGGQVLVVLGNGEEKLLFHNAAVYEEAAKAAAILKFYGVNEVLEVSMPGVVENIYLKSGQVPSGKYNGEECTTFNPAAPAVTEFKGKYRSATGQEITYTQWTVAEGIRTVMRYNEKPFAEEMASILRKFGITNLCRVGGFRYFRK
jgi:hypothetical protein